MKSNPLIEVGAYLGYKIYAKRTEAGGIAFYDDSVGGGQLVIDFTTVDPLCVKMCLALYERVDNLYDKLTEIEKKHANKI